MPIKIRAMGKEDVPTLVALHRDVFPAYNSTLLGPAYLTPLYATLAQSPACLSIVAEEEGRIVGWIGGILDYPRYFDDLRRRTWFRLPAVVFSALRRKPALLGDGAKIFLRKVAPPRRPTPLTAPTLATAHLLVIAVAPGLQARGVGQYLLSDFHDRVRAAGYAAVSLSTFTDNAAANRAFQKAGYVLVASQAGTNRYWKELLS